MDKNLSEQIDGLAEEQLHQFEARLRQLADLQHQIYGHLIQQDPQLTEHIEEHAAQLCQLEAVFTVRHDQSVANGETSVGYAFAPTGFPEAQIEALTGRETQATPQDD
ncbi:MAG: hypothetical protein ACKVP1_18140 [Burkholderiaceae bacterium]